MSHSAVRAAVPGAQRWLGWKIISLMGRHGRTLAGLLILIFIAAGLDIAVPFLTREVIDNVVRSLRSINGGSVRTLILAAMAIFAATAITRLLRSFYNYRLFRAVSQCEDEVKNAAFANFLSLDTEYHTQVNTGEIVGTLDRGGTSVLPAQTSIARVRVICRPFARTDKNSETEKSTFRLLGAQGEVEKSF
jgi:ABC-type multidrug transport system fused ATPase/permease subunit